MNDKDGVGEPVDRAAFDWAAREIASKVGDLGGELRLQGEAIAEKIEETNRALWRIAELLAEANKIARGDPHVPVS